MDVGRVKKLRIFSDGGWKLDAGIDNNTENLCVCHPERTK
jgi:hypothetical protein